MQRKFIIATKVSVFVTYQHNSRISSIQPKDPNKKRRSETSLGSKCWSIALRSHPWVFLWVRFAPIRWVLQIQTLIHRLFWLFFKVNNWIKLDKYTINDLELLIQKRNEEKGDFVKPKKKETNKKKTASEFQVEKIKSEEMNKIGE